MLKTQKPKITSKGKDNIKVDDNKIMDLTADLVIINNKLFKLLTNTYNTISEFHKKNGELKN